jgi:hypothetical protein
MPRYVAVSEAPISVVSRPDLPDWGTPENPWVPGGEGPSTGGPPLRPGHGLPPQLPPRDEWPELPPPVVRPPIPPTIEHPWVPVEPDTPDEIWPPPGVVWPPLRPELPGMPDMTGKTMVLALLYVSRHAPVWRWVVIDHDGAKSFVEKVKDWAKSRLPAGGIGGRPPVRPGPPSP